MGSLPALGPAFLFPIKNVSYNGQVEVFYQALTGKKKKHTFKI